MKTVLALVLLWSGLAFSETPDFSPDRRAVALGYPKLPAEVMHQKTDPISLYPDPDLKSDWALSAIGFFKVFTPFMHPINYDVKRCNPSLVVAVVDTGVDYTHIELKDHMWVNKGEVDSNGLDDDKNGFVDDVVGWDFVHEVPLPYDTHGHGTHISGIISATAANGFGAAGVCPGAKIMALKYYDNSGTGYNNLTNTVRALRYAVKMHADIINYSGGGSDPAGAEKRAIEEANKAGILVVAAAGNYGQDSRKSPYYPANYHLPNILSVGAHDKNGKRLESSNYGDVDIFAPGLMVLSSLPGDRMGTMSGTSQATAIVTGVAAVLMSQSDTRPTPQELKRWIIEGADPNGNLSLPGALESQRRSQKGR